MEIHKLYPDIQLTGVPCPLWVPLIENNEFNSPGADYFVQKYLNQLLSQDPEIDTIILGCTHYPLLLEKIRRYTPSHIRLVEQGQYVASSLKDYLARHPEIRTRCETGGACQFLTTESVEKFRESANVFLHQEVQVQTVTLE